MSQKSIGDEEEEQLQVPSEEEKGKRSGKREAYYDSGTDRSLYISLYMVLLCTQIREQVAW